MRLDDAGKNFIKKAEGHNNFRAYYDSVDKLTIGYGHLVIAGENYSINSVITPEEANILFERDIIRFERMVNNIATQANVTFTQNQFNALTSLAFNIPAYVEGETVKKFIETQDFLLLQNLFLQYVGVSINESTQTILVQSTEENLQIIKKAMEVRDVLELEVFNIDSFMKERIDEKIKQIDQEATALTAQARTPGNTNAVDIIKDAVGVPIENGK